MNDSYLSNIYLKILNHNSSYSLTLLVFFIQIPHNTFVAEFGLVWKTIIVYIVIVCSNVLTKCFFKGDNGNVNSI